MKNLIRAFVVALLLVAPGLAFANVSNNVAWELRATNGVDTNGGGFSVGNGGTDVSGSATLVIDGTTNTKVTSSAHNFVSGDVNKWIDVTAGTGFNKGWYQILSVASNAATLDHSPGAVSTTGGTYSLYSAVDYSQQNSPQISTTDAVTAGSTTVTSATAAFTAAHVGNICYIAGGTGSITAGWYQIATVTNGTTITVDRSTGLTTGTGATFKCGGALKTFAGLVSATTSGGSGGTAFVKAEANYTTTASNTLAHATTVIGYTTTRNDAGRFTLQGQTSTGMRLLQFNAGGYLTNGIFDCNTLGTSVGFGSTGGPFTANNWTAKNCTTSGFDGYTSNPVYVQNFEVTGGTSGSYAVSALNSSNPITLINGWIHDTAGNGVTSAFTAGFTNVMYNVTMSNVAGTCLDWNHAQNPWGIVRNNTFYACGTVIGGQIGPQDTIQNNIFANSTAWALNSQGSGGNIIPSALLDGNAYYNNASGNINNYGGSAQSTEYVNTHDVILTTSPFVNAAANNFALNNTGGGGGSLRGTALPANPPGFSATTNYQDFGASGHNITGAATGGSYTFIQ